VDNLKKVKFAFAKDAKTSAIVEFAKKKAWVPNPQAYSPNI